MKYQVLVYGIPRYETQSEIVAGAFSRLEGPHAEVCKVWKLGNYTLTKRLQGFKLDNGFTFDYLVHYAHNGKIGYSRPKMWPAYIKMWAESKIIREHERA